MQKSDAQLLRDYAESGSEIAFAGIVTRHSDLVYSAALRQVDSSDLAADVAQSVFTDLARKARELSAKLPSNASLVGWLYHSTRFAALNVRRGEFRRQKREREAMQNLYSTPEIAPDWQVLRPLMDDAMLALDDLDREALLLRFFENRDLRAIGFALGITDDAAQKRVSRALEKLREHLSRRGIKTTATALATAVTSNAVHAAPAGLAGAISTSSILAASAVKTSTAITVTKALAMTTLQKTIIAAAFITAAATCLFQTHQNSGLRQQVQSLNAQQSALNEQFNQLQQERDTAVARTTTMEQELEQSRSNMIELPRLRGELMRLQDEQKQRMQGQSSSQNTNDPFTQTVMEMAAKASKLNQALQQMPDKAIPEMKYLTPNDWLLAVKDAAALDSDADVRKALSRLRRSAKSDFARSMNGALDKYLESNNNQLPTDVSQLTPFFDPPVDPAILQRYKILRTGSANDLGDAYNIGEIAPVDTEYDSHLYIGPHGRTSSYGSGPHEMGDPDPTWAPKSTP